MTASRSKIPSATPDFSEHLEKLGELINLQTVFARAVPDEESIRVYVDGAEIGKAEKASSGAGEDVVTFGDAYDNGWSYDPGQNAVLFWGDAIPDFNQDVEIFYRPIGGNPHSLPFDQTDEEARALLSQPCSAPPPPSLRMRSMSASSKMKT